VGACLIRHAGEEGNETLVVLDELVRSGSTPAVAAARHLAGAVQNLLNGEVDVHAEPLSSNLEAIRKGGKRRMGPATAPSEARRILNIYYLRELV